MNKLYIAAVVVYSLLIIVLLLPAAIYTLNFIYTGHGNYSSNQVFISGMTAFAVVSFGGIGLYILSDYTKRKK